MRTAICLLSGGLDSTTSLYAAKEQGYEIIALTFDYGQLHAKEIEFAKRSAALTGARHFVVQVPMPWQGSALLDASIPMPQNRSEKDMNQSIPSTYVPARNSVFLALAASCAEASEAEAIFIGANTVDYSGYPDCRPEYFEAFEKMIEKGTKTGVEGRKIKIEAPLLKLTKAEIVQFGKELEVPFENTWSCYQGKEVPCKKCDSCLIRAKGFSEAGFKDPLLIMAGRVK